MTKEGRVSRRTWFALGVMLLVVPLLRYPSVRVFHGRKYLVCSPIVIVAAMLPFFMMFEGREPKAREIMVIAVLAAIGVAGRAAFFMVPSFKPVAAIVILKRHFLWRGSRFSGRVSDHDAFQHVHGTGTVDSVADVCIWHDRFSCGSPSSERNSPKARKRDLCIYGFLSVFLIYGGIMNPASALMSYGQVTWASLLAFYISGAPVDLVHAISTVIFLWFLSRPMLEKLERIKKKYGLVEP